MTSPEYPVTMRQVPPGLAAKLAESAESFASTFDAVGMDDIAKSSGIPRATLYYYFSGKDEVLTFLLRSMLTDLRISVANAAESEGDIRTRLAAIVYAQLGHLAANPSIGQLLLANLGRAGRFPAIAAGIDEGFHAPVRRLLGDEVESGSLVELDVEIVSTALFGAVTVVGFQGLVFDGRIDVDRVAEELFSLFWSGIDRDGRTRSRTKKR